MLTRTILVNDGTKTESALLEISAPVDNGSEWECVVRLNSKLAPLEMKVYGIDAVQAMEISFTYLSRVRPPKGVTYMCHDTMPGLGIQRQIPSFLGTEFYDSLCKYVDDATEAHSNELAAKHGRQSPPTPPPAG